MRLQKGLQVQISVKRDDQQKTNQGSDNAQVPKVSTSIPRIRVLQTNNKGKKRRWDKRAYCPFCKKYQKKLPRHLKEVKAHKEELEVIKWLATTDKKLKEKLLTKMRNRGNHLHNVEVREKGEGIVIPVYRPDYEADYEQYLPCAGCYGYYSKTDLWKHKCFFRDESGEPGKKTRKGEPGKKTRTQYISQSKLLLPPPPPNRSKKLHQILGGLTL